jgi:hypothetical protein
MELPVRDRCCYQIAKIERNPAKTSPTIHKQSWWQKAESEMGHASIPAIAVPCHATKVKGTRPAWLPRHQLGTLGTDEIAEMSGTDDTPRVRMV